MSSRTPLTSTARASGDVSLTYFFHSQGHEKLPIVTSTSYATRGLRLFLLPVIFTDLGRRVHSVQVRMHALSPLSDLRLQHKVKLASRSISSLLFSIIALTVSLVSAY
jgi:hypothetical protein